MQFYEIEDGSGYKFSLVDVEGLSFMENMVGRLFTGGTTFKSHVEDVKNMEIRDSDILICSYPKSGTHWSWEVVSMLMKGKAEYETKRKTAAMLDFRDISEIDTISSPRVLNTHHPVHLLPKQARDGKCKLIHVLRNPRDVVVSLYHHIRTGWKQYVGSFSDFLPVFYGVNGKDWYYSWFQYELEYEKFKKENANLPILTLFYEDMKKDLKAEAKKIVDFLNLDCDDEFVADVAQKCQFQKLKQADKDVKVNTGALASGDKETDMKTASPSRPDIFRKGEVGDWKNWFSVAEDEYMESIYRDRMKDSDLTFTYSL